MTLLNLSMPLLPVFPCWRICCLRTPSMWNFIVIVSLRHVQWHYSPWFVGYVIKCCNFAEIQCTSFVNQMIYDGCQRRNWGIASSRGLSNTSNWVSLNIKFRYGWMMLYGVHDVELLCKFNNTFTFHGSCILIKFKDLDGNCCSWKFSFYVSIFRRFKEFLFGCFISKLGVLGNFNFSSFLLGFF